MYDFNFQRAQAEYEAQLPPEYKGPICKKCGEFNEPYLYDGFCLDCFAKEKLKDKDIVRYFATEEERERFLNDWLNSLYKKEKYELLMALYLSNAENADEDYKDYAESYFEDFKDYLKGEFYNEREKIIDG